MFNQIIEEMKDCNECALTDHHITHLSEISESHNITLTEKDLEGSGLVINIPGYKGDPNDISDNGQIYIEFHEGKILIHVWNGPEDPTTITIDKK